MNFLPKQEHYPSKIYAATEAYTVVFVKNLKCYGETDPEKHVIRLKDGMSRRSLFVTFVHELLHVLEFEHNIPIKHKMVYQLERAITELIFDNFLGGATPDEDPKLRTDKRCLVTRDAPKRPGKLASRKLRKARRR